MLTYLDHVGDERDLSAKEKFRKDDHRRSHFHLHRQYPRQYSFCTLLLLKSIILALTSL